MSHVEACKPLSWPKILWLIVLSSFVGPVLGTLLFFGVMVLRSESLFSIETLKILSGFSMMGAIFFFPAGLMGGLVLLWFRHFQCYQGGLSLYWVGLAGLIGGSIGGAIFGVLAAGIAPAIFLLVILMALLGMIAASSLWFVRSYLGLGDL